VKETDTEFFRPLWRRLLVTAICVVWAGLEWFVWHDEMFRWLTLAMVAYAVWNFFIAFGRNQKKAEGEDAQPKN
jgi:hypothetical protein